MDVSEASSVRVEQESSGGMYWDGPAHLNRHGKVPNRYCGYRILDGENSRRLDNLVLHRNVRVRMHPKVRNAEANRVLGNAVLALKTVLVLSEGTKAARAREHRIVGAPRYGTTS